MAAHFPGVEKGAGTLPLTVFEAGGVNTMLSTKLYTEFGEGNSVGLLGIAPGFLYLPY